MQLFCDEIGDLSPTKFETFIHIHSTEAGRLVWYTLYIYIKLMFMVFRKAAKFHTPRV